MLSAEKSGDNIEVVLYYLILFFMFFLSILIISEVCYLLKMRLCYIINYLGQCGSRIISLSFVLFVCLFLLLFFYVVFVWYLFSELSLSSKHQYWHLLSTEDKHNFAVKLANIKHALFHVHYFTSIYWMRMSSFFVVFSERLSFFK